MNSSKNAPWSAAVLGVLLVIGGSVAPTSAAEDPGVPSRAPSASHANCLLLRVGDQYVRCDNLTGAGVPAPRWIPEQ